MSKICGVWTAGDFNAKECIGYNFGEGIKKLGYKIDQHYPALLNPFSPPFCHLVVANGFRENTANTASRLKEMHNVDTLVYDLGYVHRSDTKIRDGYYQLGINRLGWITDLPCPSDRFNNLNVIIPSQFDSGKDTVLICAQKFNDPQHGFNREGMIALMEEQSAKYEKLGYEVIVRPHPKSKFESDTLNISIGPLNEALDNCRFVVVYNSTLGTEALLRGVPVIAISEEVHYKTCTATLEGDILTLPSVDTLRDYFYRLAYSQWRLEEMKEGYPFKFLLSIIAGEDPFDQGVDYTSHQSPVDPVREPLTVEGLPWRDAQKLVKLRTGKSVISKIQLEAAVEEYNGKA